MRISLDALQILDAIDTQGSYAAAASRLHRVPSALSHAMQKLEGELGVELFEKSGRRAILTAAGRTLLEDGRHLLRAALELESRVKRVATGWETELSIAVDSVIPGERLYPLLQHFYDEGHGTRLRLSYEVLGGCWDALTTGRADLVIGAPGDMPARGGIATRPLGTMELVFTMAPGHPLSTVPEPIPAHELARHRAVVLADTSRELAARTSGLLEGQDALRVPDMQSKAAAQAAGLGGGPGRRSWRRPPAALAGGAGSSGRSPDHQDPGRTQGQHPAAHCLAPLPRGPCPGLVPGGPGGAGTVPSPDRGSGVKGEAGSRLG